ncbi:MULTISPECIES: hemin ABC transporter permease protein IsdF [Staphylococcus]|uniref:Probable heme-iron transport system permease protein IsdF n=2 Tax=Staphylococcus TaxID=1279 RepID=A0ABY1H463_9STAP|nr:MULTISPECIES: hemin ABC transporter permease protein IsdF [Staphylococcus]ATH62899.1 heme ABC transporter permease [Staphylococcus pasteuri]KKI57091.1 Heme transporter IsdDEF, permease component IsdF [Staphylococcus pasteuri]MBM6507052.1 hemin ABC transporter permease protein IsdF [Staphylococcus pasteuri]MCF7598852.1 hemin ABC transporter permease protein IsdF [Staphylococcus pasteuri]MDI3231223.1 hemin ABC transporter permease protein IsdF [Staphylococcus pasteuri]
MIKNHKKLFLIIFILLTVLTAYLSFVTGTLKITFNDWIDKLSTGENNAVDAILDLRLPRILIAMIVGAMLAVSGALLQASLQNPLAEANLIGVSTGALIMRTLCMMYIPQLYNYLPFLVFIGGLIPFIIIIFLHTKYQLNAVSMILVGVALFVLLNGVYDILSQNPLLKMSQGLTMKTWKDVYIIAISAMIGLSLSILLSPKLNLLNLDDMQAKSIGFQIDTYRWIIGLLAVFLASATVAIVGQIAFLGIIVPHIVRKIVGVNYKAVIPFSIVIGAWFLLLADLAGRTIHPPLEIPANAILMIVGGPTLIYLLCKGKRQRIYKSM